VGPAIEREHIRVKKKKIVAQMGGEDGKPRLTSWARKTTGDEKLLHDALKIRAKGKRSLGQNRDGKIWKKGLRNGGMPP